MELACDVFGLSEQKAQVLKNDKGWEVEGGDEKMKYLKEIVTGFQGGMGLYLLMLSVEYNKFFPMSVIPLLLGVAEIVGALIIFSGR